MREKFYFFWTFWETAQAIEDKDQRLEYLEAVIRHWIGDEEKELSPLVNALMVQTRFTLDRSQEISDSASERWKKWWAPKWNTNAVKDWNIIQSARISYMNGMRNVEIRWKQLINKWNSITHREEFMNEELKKALYNLQSIPISTFEERVAKYQSLCDRIKENKAEKLFYYPIWERDLLKFISKINLFYWDDSIIISKIAHKDWVIKDRAVRLLTQEKQKEENYSDLLEKIY